jgi:REP element-mobilizing transposase RayT
MYQEATPMPGNRASMRLKDYNYAQEGAYYVTICVNERRCIFGNIQNGQMVLNKIGKMVDMWWQKLPDKYNEIGIGEYQIMPNHIHGIITIVGAHLCVRPDPTTPDDNIGRTHGSIGRTHGSAPTTLGTIVQWFKTMSTNEYIRNVKCNNWPPFNKRIWQRNYYEHIIRNETELNKIREYINNNPANWESDDYYTV